MQKEVFKTLIKEGQQEIQEVELYQSACQAIPSKRCDTSSISQFLSFLFGILLFLP